MAKDSKAKGKMMLLENLIILERCENGASPARVYRCKILQNGAICYLKKIDKKFGNTTYNVLREARILQDLEGILCVPKVLELGEQHNDEYMILSALKGRHIETYAPLEYVAHCANALRTLQAVDIAHLKANAKNVALFDVGLDVRLKELGFNYAIIEKHALKKFSIDIMLIGSYEKFI